MTDRTALIARYCAYLDACNDRDWDALVRFLADRVLVNGQEQTPEEYVSNVRATVEIFPDYRWELRRAVVEGEWLAIHLHDTGTRARPFLGAPGDNSAVETDEFDLYRIVDGLIHEVEGTADNARLAAQPQDLL